MSVRLRMGPMSVSSRGRVGVHAGPVSISGGGRRRSSSGGGFGALIVLVLIAAAVGLAVSYWYITVPVIALGVFIALLARRQNAQAREQARQRWLAAPPAPLLVPGRFTDKWFREHVPFLHPGQVPMLLEALQERGWGVDRIEQRVTPYLRTNPYWRK